MTVRLKGGEVWSVTVAGLFFLGFGRRSGRFYSRWALQQGTIGLV